jgi:hypothetical protein
VNSPVKIAVSSPFSYFILMRLLAKSKGKAKNIPFDPIFFAATVPARKANAKDLKDVKEHDAMDDAVKDV